MKKSWLCVGLLCLVGLVYAVCSLYALPNVLQTEVQNPKLEEVKLDSPYATELLSDSLSVSSEEGSLNASVRAVNAPYFSTFHVQLLEGRLLYAFDDDNVIVLDEKTALKLFPSVSPLARQVKVNDKFFTVVGVIKKAPFSRKTNVFIPLLWAKKNKMEWQLLTYSANLDSTSRSEFMFSGLPTTTVWDIGKEVSRALLSLKFTLYLACLWVLGLLLHRQNGLVKKAFLHLKKLNEEKYPREFPWQIVLFVLLCVVGYGVLATGYALSLRFMVGAVIAFPEYIPEILVDFKLIAQTYQTNLDLASKLVVLKTDLVVQVEHFGHLIQVLMPTLLFCAFVLLLGKRKKASKGKMAEEKAKA